MKRQRIGIVFLLSLVLPTLAAFVFLEARKEILRERVQQSLRSETSEENLCVLTFSSSDIDGKLVWKDHKEFSYKGEMYDVVRTEKSGDKISYYCWHDVEETKLNSQLESLFYLAIGSDPPSNKNTEYLTHVFRSMDIPASFQYTLPFFTLPKIGTGNVPQLSAGCTRSCWNPPSCS